MPHDEERIDAAVEAIAYGVYDSGALYDPHRWWPRSYLPYSPLFAADFHGRWLTQWRGLPEDVPRPYTRSTALWVLLAMASRSLKTMFEVRERRDIFHSLLDDIQSAKAGDIFCRDGRHRVLSPVVAQTLVDRLDFYGAADRGVDKAFSSLNATLLAYSEAVFFSANCTVRDVHGPYEVVYESRPCQLLVRDYYRLRDGGLEPETTKLAYDAVRVYSLYDNSVHFSFSVLNDYVSDCPLPSVVIAHAAELAVDGATTVGTMEVAQDCTARLAAVIAVVSARMRESTQLDETLEIIRRTYYRASPIAAAARQDWEPDSVFRASLVKQLGGFNGTMPPSMTRNEFSAMVDPRV